MLTWAPSSGVRLRAEPLPMTGPTMHAADAWEAVYRSTYPRLFAYSRRRLHSDHEADDVVAETMARAVAGTERFDPGDPGIEGWLFGICRNVLHERWRTQRRDQRWADVAPSLLPGPEDGPLDRVLRDEERKRLVEAFARLRPDEQDVLELRVTAGLDAEQVARALGKRPGAVRMAQSRALSRLRTFLEEVT